MGQHELLPRPGDADVGESPLLLQLLRIVQRTRVWEDAFFEPDDEHDRKLETLRRVHRHQRHMISIIKIVGVGDERHLLEKLVDGGELTCHVDQLEDVLLTPG